MIAFESAGQLAKRIRKKEISSRELTDLYIARIEKYDNEINSVIVRTFEKARAAAEAADAALARRILRALHGVPMSIKESYVIEGTPATWGIEAFRNNVAASDGLAAPLQRSGAHFGQDQRRWIWPTFKATTQFMGKPVILGTSREIQAAPRRKRRSLCSRHRIRGGL